MNTDLAIPSWEGRELESVLSFWIENRHEWPLAENARRELLKIRMSDQEVVESRLAELPAKLRDLVRFSMEVFEWRKPFELEAVDAHELPIESYEIAPVTQALIDRGFFISRRMRGSRRPSAFSIPAELGPTLELVFSGGRRPAESSLSLALYLRALSREALEARAKTLGYGDLLQRPRRELREALTDPKSVRERIAALKFPEAAEFLPRVGIHGGVLDAGARRRLDVDIDSEGARRLGQELEESFLGCFEDGELANQGVQIGDGWIVLFREVTEALLKELPVDEDAADEGIQTAADGFADLRGIARNLEETPFRIKKTGEFYKTAIRRVAKEALSPAARPQGEEEDLLFYLQMMSRLDFVRPAPAGHLELTTNWREWQRKSVEDRGEDLLAYCRRRGDEKISPFHLRLLRRNFFRHLAKAGFETWVPTEVAVLAARNEYLKEAVRPEHAHRYQDRHKRHSFPPLASPDEMRRTLESWLVKTPVRLGIIEPSYREDERRPFALRLSRFGAKLLGLEIEERPAQGAGIILNADYELILFPENAGFDVIQEVGRFAERVKADYAIHFLLTRESVQAAASNGCGEREILKLLELHSAHEIPKNVAFSIREWCSKTTRLETRRAFLLEGPDEEAVERLLAIKDFKRHVVRRLSPTVLEINEDPSTSGFVPLLRDRGFYL